MADVGLIWKDGKGDILINEAGTDLQEDFDLRTSIIVSLFSDSRAQVSELPSTDDDPRGWWNAEIGSLLWLLQRAKLIERNLEKGKTYIRNALNWLLTERIASDVIVDGAIENLQRFRFTIRVVKTSESRFDHLWRGIENQLFEFDRSKFFITFN
jgi:phage gp46-like protein